MVFGAMLRERNGKVHFPWEARNGMNAWMLIPYVSNASLRYVLMLGIL